MKTITLTINGKTVNCPPDTSILNAAEDNDIYIPTLCNYHELKPHGACRICIVEDEKSNRLFASCVTPAADHMIIHTNSPRVVDHRKNIVHLMMAEHPDSCLVCTKSNRCDLRKIATELDIGESNLYPMPNYTPLDQSTPYIYRDMTKCILCGKCIRACKELVVNGTIDYNSRGFTSRPSTAGSVSLLDSDCLFCGTCASICPTGAITQSSGIYSGTAKHYHESICGFCGVGCSISLGITDNKIIEVCPSEKKESVNGITLCVRGHFALDYLKTTKRLTAPMIRNTGEMEITSWRKAVDTMCDRLLTIKEKYGADAIGFYGSSKCTNEENYLFQKLARAGIGTGNIDNGGFIYGRTLMKLIDRKTGVTCRINKLEDLQFSDVIFVAGASPESSAPVFSYHIRRAVKKGAALIVMNHNESELSKLSDIRLKITSGINFAGHCTALLNLISASLLKREEENLQFVEWFTSNYDDFCDELNTYDVEKALEKTDTSIETIEEAVSLIAGKKISFVVGEELLESDDAQAAINAFINLSILAGCFGCQGCGLHIISVENNLVGSWDMGTVPDMLPGREALENETVRFNFESEWDRGAFSKSGLDITGMIKSAEEGKLKALYIMGENPLRALPQSGRIEKALKQLDLLIVQDIIGNETTELADVVLPAAPFCEKSGSFTNMEGRIQSFTAAVTPPENAKSDFEILCMVAGALGVKASGIEQIRKEISNLVPLYAELEMQAETAWVRRELPGDTNDEAYKKITFSPTQLHDNKQPEKGYPYTAVITSSHFQAGSGTRTSISERIRQANVDGTIELSEETGSLLNFKDGESIRIISPHGSITRNFRINPSIDGQFVYIPSAFNNNDVMDLLPLTDPETGDFNGFKRCQVRIEKG